MNVEQFGGMRIGWGKQSPQTNLTFVPIIQFNGILYINYFTIMP
jgi:hypothetical protein